MAKPLDASSEPVVLAHAPCLQLGAIELHPPLLQAVAGDHAETLEPRVMQVLVALAQAQAEGRIVTRDELITRCWDGRVVGENAIHRVMSRIRHLASGLGAGSFELENIPRVGYRIVHTGPATPTASRHDDIPAHHRKALAAPGPRRRVPMLAALLAVLALLATAIWWPHPPAQSIHGIANTPTLAVLPFKTLSPGPRDELMELGMAETLIARLSASDGIRVHALESARRLARENPDALQVARALEANHAIDGTIQVQGDRIRVTVRLLALPSGTVTWSDTFDAMAGEVFTLQDDIAHAVSQALALKLPASALAQRSPCDGGDADLYRQYLGARYLLSAPVPERLHRAIGMFRRILERDPLCARAWAGQAFAWRTLAIVGDARPTQNFPLADAAITHALALNPHLVEAHAERGFKQFWYDWDWQASEQSLLHAIALSPSSADARRAYAHLLNNLGESERALEQIALSRQIDPMSPLENALHGQFLLTAGHTDEARRQLDHTLTLAPDFWVALFHQGGIEMQRGNAAAAIHHLARASEQSRGNSIALSSLAVAHAHAGQHEQAETILRQLQQRSVSGYVPPTSLAAVETALGRHERALELLEQAYEERDLRLAFMKVDMRWNPLLAHPRFTTLAERMNLHADHAIGW